MAVIIVKWKTLLERTVIRTTVGLSVSDGQEIESSNIVSFIGINKNSDQKFDL